MLDPCCFGVTDCDPLLPLAVTVASVGVGHGTICSVIVAVHVDDAPFFPPLGVPIEVPITFPSLCVTVTVRVAASATHRVVWNGPAIDVE